MKEKERKKKTTERETKLRERNTLLTQREIEKKPCDKEGESKKTYRHREEKKQERKENPLPIDKGRQKNADKEKYNNLLKKERKHSLLKRRSEKEKPY